VKVFLSWSGDVSKQVAIALRDWLPNVIQAIEPWMSSEDIDKGVRWSSEIAKELDDSAAGIICVVPGNYDAPWLNFEAGALSKAFGKDKVCPYLFRVKPADLTGPLVQFQISEANNEDTHRLLSSLNKSIEPKSLPEAKLAQTFGKWWPELEGQLAAIGERVPRREPRRSAEDMLEEVLSIVRDQRRSTDEIIEKSFVVIKHMLDDLSHSSRSEQAWLRHSILESPPVQEALAGKLYQTRKSAGISPPPKSTSIPTQSIRIKPDEPPKK
jgi:hypothetical protein